MANRKNIAKRPTKNLKKKRGISKLQALAVAGALAAIGVVAVVLSHASGTPNYQYSYSRYCVAERGTSSEAAVQKCTNTSAEAMVYRLYRGLLNRDPSASENQYWTQQLAGDRVKIMETGLVQKQVKTFSDDKQFVTKLYSDMLKRPATTKEVTSWTNRLKATGNKKWSREKVAYQFAISSEAISKNQAGLNAFLATTPKVTVVQNAANDQRDRFDAMFTDYQQPNKKDMESASRLANQAQSQFEAAANVAAKSKPTQADLNAIASNKANVQSYYNQSKSYATTTANRVAAAKRLYSRAKDLADFATDIRDNTVYGLSKIGDRYNATKTYAATAAGKPQAIKGKIDAIANKYVAAENKFRLEQARIAEANRHSAYDALPTYPRPTASSCNDAKFQFTRTNNAVINGENVGSDAGKTANFVSCKDKTTGINRISPLTGGPCPANYDAKTSAQGQQKFLYCKKKPY